MQKTASTKTQPATVICTYRVLGTKEKEFALLLARHWPTLKRLGLVTDEPPLAFRGEEPGGAPFYVEIFTWKDAAAPGRAHELPEVAAIWEPMGACAEERGGRPKFEFPHVERVKLS